MEFKLDTVVILVFMILFGMVIMAVTIPLLLWQPYEETLNREAEGRIQHLERLDIERLRWNISIPGSDILNLIEGDGGQDFYIFVQTRGQNGRVVNYGRQLRQAGSQSIHIHSGVIVPDTVNDEWVYHHVINARDLFGFNSNNQLVNVDTPGVAGQRPAFNQLAGNAQGIPITTDPTGSARAAVSNVLFPGPNNQAVNVGSDPLLSFFCPMLTRAAAHNQGRAFAAAGTLFTGPRAHQPGNINQSTARARVQDSLWYINGVAHFLSIGIVDPSGILIGFYFEEQGVGTQTNFLAMAFEIGEPIIEGVFGQ